MTDFVAYLRVSTDKQGASGLGLEAQKAAITAFAANGSVVATYTEIESGKRTDRPQLAAALAHAKKIGATLLIAKLDRLARNVHFISGLMESGVQFVAADMPNADRFTLHIMAAVAEQEARAISARTKAALQAAKKRGVKLGGFRGGNPALSEGARARSIEARRAAATRHAARVREAIADLDWQAMSLRVLAATLEARGVTTSRGGKTWTAAAVKRALAA